MLDATPRDVDIYAGPAWLLLQNVRPSKKKTYAPAGSVQMFCKCGRVECPVSFTKSNREGRRIYATPECEEHAKRLRDKSRYRKPDTFEPKKLEGDYYCLSCQRYTEHANNKCACGRERCRV